MDIRTAEKMMRRFAISVLGVAIVEKPEPLWELMAWHGRVIENVLADRPTFAGLMTRPSG